MKVQVISKESKIDEDTFQPVMEAVVKITLPLEPVRDDASNGEIAKIHRLVGSAVIEELSK